MENTKTLSEIRQLFQFHKEATALDMEYTDEIYKYLVEKNAIVLTSQQKLDIFAQAKRLFVTELSMQVESDELDKSKAAQVLLYQLKINKLPPEQTAYIGSICMRISIKQYFDSIEKLPL